MPKKILLGLTVLPLLLVTVVGCGKKSTPPPTTTTPQATNPPAERPVDPALLDDGLDEALKELDAVE